MSAHAKAFFFPKDKRLHAMLFVLLPPGKSPHCLNLTGSAGPVRSDQTRESFARANVLFVLILSSDCRFGFYWCCCISPQLIALLWEKLLLDCVSGGGDKREGDEARPGPRKIRQEQSEFKIIPPSPSLCPSSVDFYNTSLAPAALPLS